MSGQNNEELVEHRFPAVLNSPVYQYGLPRQSLCTWGKSTQTLFSISIKPYFQVRKSHPTSSQENKEKMVRPWVKVSLCQCNKLKRLRENSGKPLSGMLREAVFRLVQKKKHPVSTTISHLPKGTRDKYKYVSAYFSTSDWDLLEKISKGTGTCKTGLIREAVDEYMTELPRALHLKSKNTKSRKSAKDKETES